MDLAELTTLRLGGPAPAVIEAATEDVLVDAVRIADEGLVDRHLARLAPRQGQRVSRCGWCLRQRGQNFASSMRSGSLRRFFLVM